MRDRLKRRKRAGLTLVELAAIVSVFGMVVAVAIPTLARSVRASKVSEASEQLDALYRASAAYYATARNDADGSNHFCLPLSAGPTPDIPTPSPVLVDFLGPSVQGSASWQALGFTPHVPLRYRYSFMPTTPGCAQPEAAANALVLRAEGDLDGDGLFSTFERRATVESSGVLLPDPVLHIEDRIE
jgi:type II secretory pathway pseudopilin PulG